VISVVNSLLLHHDPVHYASPNSFDPERWNASSVDALLEDDHNLSFLTYGAGKKRCPANKFAMMQQAITLASAVKKMRFEYLEKRPPKVETGFGARTQPFKIRTTKR
jgi:cytochrome P450